jgi:hypothetical protein
LLAPEPSDETCDEELNRRLNAIESKVSRAITQLDALQQLVAGLAASAVNDDRPGVPRSRLAIQGHEWLIWDNRDSR